MPNLIHMQPSLPDAHALVKGDLEGGALVLRADHGLQLLGIHRFLHLCEQPGDRLNLLGRLALQGRWDEDVGTR